jgi:conjugal transfer ATP-binding protein TraC
MAKEKKFKEKPVKQKKPKRRIIESNQNQIPIRDITDNTIITSDYRAVQILEVQAIGFQNMKNAQQNRIRSLYERLIRNSPDSFQIKSVSTPADLTRQIKDAEDNGKGETNEECRKLNEQYVMSLKAAQSDSNEHHFYVAYGETNCKGKSLADFKKISRKESIAGNRLAADFRQCGNAAHQLNNEEILQLFYRLYNRGSFLDHSFEDRCGELYQKYREARPNNSAIENTFYIPPTDYIAPKKMMMFNDRNFVVCDDRYYTFLYVAGNDMHGFPSYIWCDWLDMFVNSYEGVDVDVYVEKMDERDLSTSLLRTLGHTGSDMDTNRNSISEAYDNAANKFVNAKYMLDCLRSGENAYDVSIMITVSGSSVQQVNSRAEELINNANKSSIKLRTLPYQEELAFRCSMPLNYLAPAIKYKAKRNMSQRTTTSTYLFNTDQLIHPNGLYIADSTSRSPILLDLWNTLFVANPHIFICGTSGSGKTSAMELLACHARVMNIPVYIIAPEKQNDYRRLCDALGGQFIDLGSGTSDRINIMEIFENDVNVEAMKKEIYGNKSISYLSSRIGVVSEFIRTFYTDMNVKSKSLLNRALVETYARKGITADNESLWADTGHTHYKQMPILSDLAAVLKEMGKDAEELYAAVEYLTMGEAEHFNGQTNVNIHNKFFVIGLENNSKQMLPLSAFVAEDFCQLKIREDTTTHSMFFIDEEWAMLQTDSIAEKMREDSKILRGFGCAMINGTQQMSDVLENDVGKDILKNSQTKIILKHEDVDMGYLTKNVDLTENETKQIMAFVRGDALLLANEVRIPIHFSPTPYEQLLTFNDSDTLLRWKEYIRQKKEKELAEKKRQEQLAKARDISEIKHDIRTDIKGILVGDEYAKNLFGEGEHNND